MLGTTEREPHFRIVGNVAFQVIVHELADPKFGPFDLNDAKKLPYDEMINRFIQSVTQTLTSVPGDKKAG